MTILELENKLRERLTNGQDQDSDDEINKELISLLVKSKDVDTFNKLLPIYMASLSVRGTDAAVMEIVNAIPSPQNPYGLGEDDYIIIDLTEEEN